MRSRTTTVRVLAELPGCSPDAPPGAVTWNQSQTCLNDFCGAARLSAPTEPEVARMNQLPTQSPVANCRAPSLSLARSLWIASYLLLLLGVIADIKVTVSAAETAPITGVWTLKDVPAPGGSALTLTIEQTAAHKLRLLLPKDLQPAANGELLLERNGADYVAHSATGSTVTFTPISAHKAHLLIDGGSKGFSKFSIELQRAAD